MSQFTNDRIYWGLSFPIMIVKKEIEKLSFPLFKKLQLLAFYFYIIFLNTLLNLNTFVNIYRIETYLYEDVL